MRLSASRSCLVAGAKPRRVLPRAGAITSRFESPEKLWRRRDERTSFGPSRRDSNPCFSLERASPLVERWRGTRLPGPSPAPPFQTVRARLGHTAYRWSLGVKHAQRQDSVLFPTSDRARAPKTSRTTSGRPLRVDASARRGVEPETARAVATRSGRSE